MDLIAARNLLIYLKGDLQKKLMPLFHYALKENGILYLSPSETVGEFTDLFLNIDRKWKIYQSKPSPRTIGRLPQLPLQQFLTAKAGKENAETARIDFAEAADRVLMSEYAPPYVVIDGADNVVHVRGDTGKYLKLAEGAATMNILEMARRGLMSNLSLAIRSARRQKAEVRRERVRVDSWSVSTVDIVVRLVPVQGQSADLMIIFKESLHEDAPSDGNKIGKKKKTGPDSEKDQYTLELEQELKRSREDLQASIEELETSNEELKSANEELLSSNEELQSTNEELETSREELRSVNEELSSVNSENLEKIEQLNCARDDMRNLLNALDVAAVFLDMDLNIKSYTPAATNFFSLRQSDIGRPIADLSSYIENKSLAEDVRAVLKTAARMEKEVQVKNGRWHLLRIIPYRGQDHKLHGALLIFFDINQQRILEAALHYTQSIVDTVREPMLVLDDQLCVVSTNRSFCQAFRVSDEETVGKHVYEIGNREWDIPELRRLLEEIVPQNSHFKDFPVEFNFPRIGRRRMILNARRLYHELGSQRILLAMDDVTGQSWADSLFRETESEKKNGPQ
jgi:two-component system CheB/CheR fusion protein